MTKVTTKNITKNIQKKVMRKESNGTLQKNQLITKESCNGRIEKQKRYDIQKRNTKMAAIGPYLSEIECKQIELSN